MADYSDIEWTDATWQPITGCEIVSPGCINCYAMRLAAGRLRHHPSRKGLTVTTKAGPVWTGEVRFNAAWLTQPLKWKEPRRIFVCAHGDLFAEGVPDEWIDKVFAVMALAPQHTFQVLTKRAERMRAYLSAARAHPVGMEAMGLTFDSMAKDPRSTIGTGVILQGDIAHLKVWPLPNVWLGISAERQKEADERIPLLLQTPAAVRFVSCEPLIGPLSFRWAKWDDWKSPNGERRPEVGHLDGLRMLDWIIVGGESGPNARPMHPLWARNIRDECAEAGVPLFFKQWGNWIECEKRGGRYAVADRNTTVLKVTGASRSYRPDGWEPSGPDDLTALMENVGKKSAGRTLDSSLHSEMPRGRG